MSNLYLSIVALHRLLSQKENREEEYQKYFESNDVVFTALGFDAAVSFEKKSKNKLPFDKERGFRPEPDFLCVCRSSGLLTVFELKTPFVRPSVISRADGNRVKLRAELESYCSQVAEYIECIRGSEAARRTVQQALGIEGIANYRAQIVYGLESDNNGLAVHQIVARRNPSIEIISFDRLREQLLSAYKLGATDTNREDGWTFSTVLALNTEQSSKPSYVFDVGSERFSRVSLLIKERLLTLRVIDSDGETHRLQARFAVGKPIYIRTEISTSGRNSFLNFCVDAESAERRSFQIPIDLRLDISNFVVGADLNGRNGAAFDLMHKLFMDRTLSLFERIELDVYLLQRLAQRERIRFNGATYMRRDARNNLVAPSDSLRPVFISKN